MISFKLKLLMIPQFTIEPVNSIPYIQTTFLNTKRKLASYWIVKGHIVLNLGKWGVRKKKMDYQLMFPVHVASVIWAEPHW